MFGRVARVGHCGEMLSSLYRDFDVVWLFEHSYFSVVRPFTNSCSGSVRLFLSFDFVCLIWLVRHSMHALEDNSVAICLHPDALL